MYKIVQYTRGIYGSCQLRQSNNLSQHYRNRRNGLIPEYIVDWPTMPAIGDDIDIAPGMDTMYTVTGRLFSLTNQRQVHLVMENLNGDEETIIIILRRHM